jgi:hypothetical protein
VRRSQTCFAPFFATLRRALIGARVMTIPGRVQVAKVILSKELLFSLLQNVRCARRLRKQVTCGCAQMTCTTPSSWAPAANYLLALTRMHILQPGISWERRTGGWRTARTKCRGGFCAAAEFDYYYHCRRRRCYYYYYYYWLFPRRRITGERERALLPLRVCISLAAA